MSKTWSDSEKSKMRDTAEYYMIDEGYRQVRSVTINSIGEGIESWLEDTTPTICGLQMHSGRENKSDHVVTTYEATLRLPYDFMINEKDKFRISKFRGETANMLFSVSTPPQWGLTAKTVGLRKVDV